MKALARQSGSCSPGTDCERRVDIGKALLLAALRIYKSWISPALPAACRYMPTCSEYAMEAVEEHGAVRGLWLALRRIARCHPFGGHGVDPVPPRAVEQTHFCQQRAEMGHQFDLAGNSPTSAKSEGHQAPGILSFIRYKEDAATMAERK